MTDAAYWDGMELVGGCPHDIFYITPTPIDLEGLYLQVNLEKGQLFVLAAHEHHVYSSDPEDPMGLAWVEFGGGNSTPLVQHLLDIAGPVFGGEVFQEVMSLCTAILYHPDRHNPKISQILYDMLMKLCAEAETDISSSTANQEIIRYIEDNLGSHLTLSEVAGYFGYHPSYFSARFSKITGMPFSKYVMYRRMSRACLLLMTTQMSIEQIAQSLGFYDLSHFTQRFKAAEGITPSRYRRESRGLTGQVESVL